MAVTQLSGPWGKLIDEKNQKTEIWCPCTFKYLYIDSAKQSTPTTLLQTE